MPSISLEEEGLVMKFISHMFIISLTLMLNSVWADTNVLYHHKTLTTLDGDWILSPADTQEGGATKKLQRQNLLVPI